VWWISEKTYEVGRKRRRVINKLEESVFVITAYYSYFGNLPAKLTKIGFNSIAKDAGFIFQDCKLLKC
jgi:hypothetical protein